jgi:ribosome biogenesis GTPase A
VCYRPKDRIQEKDIEINTLKAENNRLLAKNQQLEEQLDEIREMLDNFREEGSEDEGVENGAKEEGETGNRAGNRNRR